MTLNKTGAKLKLILKKKCKRERMCALSNSPYARCFFIVMTISPKCCFAIVLYYTSAVNSQRSKSLFTAIHWAQNDNSGALPPGAHSRRRAVCSFERGDSAEEVSHQCQRQQWASGWSINLRLAAPPPLRSRAVIGVELRPF